MPSPFSGMDPWLEDQEIFPNLHDRLCIYLQDALNIAMPVGYVATTKNRVWVDTELRREPDVALFGQENVTHNRGGVATLAGLSTIVQEQTYESIEEPYLEIVSAKGKRLVTAIEVVSLANKMAGARGRESYRDKQEEFRLGGVHLVEIDLLRRGPHVSAPLLSQLRAKLGAFDYHVSVTVAGSQCWYHAAGIRLQDALPRFEIPLDAGVPNVAISLQPILDRVYDGGRYPSLIDYSQPCDPPLTSEQQTWAETILREKGLLNLQ